MRTAIPVFALCIASALISCSTPSKPRLTAAEAIHLATAAAKQKHVDFTTLLPPNAKFVRRSHRPDGIEAHWFVWWDQKPDKHGKVTIGGDYSALVMDGSSKVDLFPGR